MTGTAIVVSYEEFLERRDRRRRVAAELAHEECATRPDGETPADEDRVPSADVEERYQRGSDRRRRESPPNPPEDAGFGRASLTVSPRPPI